MSISVIEVSFTKYLSVFERNACDFKTQSNFSAARNIVHAHRLWLSLHIVLKDAPMTNLQWLGWKIVRTHTHLVCVCVCVCVHEHLSVNLQESDKCGPSWFKATKPASTAAFLQIARMFCSEEAAVPLTLNCARNLTPDHQARILNA